MKQLIFSFIGAALMVLAVASSCKKIDTKPTPDGLDTVVNTLAYEYYRNIAGHHNNIYALRGDTVFKINTSGVRTALLIGARADTGVTYLNGLATDLQGNVYTIARKNTGKYAVVKTDSNGRVGIYINKLPRDTTTEVFKMAISSLGDVYFSNAKGLQKLAKNGTRTHMLTGVHIFTLDSAQNVVYAVNDTITHNVKLNKLTGHTVTTMIPAGYFRQVTDLTTDAFGNIYASEISEPNNKIHKLVPGGTQILLAAPRGHVDGPASQSRIYDPFSLAVNYAGVFFAETNGSKSNIRRIYYTK